MQLVLDGWQVTNPAVTALRTELGTDESQRSWLHVCTGLSPEGNTAACIGTKGQHNKFYLFSETGGRQDVVVQSSAPGIELRELNDAGQLPGRIHSKYLLIEGGYDGDPDARWVVTGSPSFNHTSLRRNDETMLRTDIKSVYARYRANFETMFAAAG